MLVGIAVYRRVVPGLSAFAVGTSDRALFELKFGQGDLA